MSSFCFPTLDSIRQGLPREEPVTEAIAWVQETRSEPVGRPAFGWSPPTLDTVMAPSLDLELERRIAQDEGFRQGYAAGLISGNEQGVAEGLRQGHADATAERRADVEAFRQALAETAMRVQPAVERWQEEVEARAAELAIEAVRALLAAELAIDRPSALGIVREAIGFAAGATRATIRLAPFDRAEMAEHREEILAACAGLREVELVDDASIEGGCVIETESGVVDGTLATRLTLLEAA